MKTLYIDMDGVLADFGKAIKDHPLRVNSPFDTDPDLIPDIFKDLDLMPGAYDAVCTLIDSGKFDVYILTTAPWENPGAWMHKRLWIEDKFGDRFEKRVIITHHKDQLIGDYLIDDRTARGAGNFKGEHIHFGVDYETGKDNKYPTWSNVLEYLLPE